MKLGISTACLYPMETEKSLETLLGLGFQSFEVFLNTFSEMEPAFLKEMKKRVDDAGARIVSVHPFTCIFENMLFFTEYERRTQDGIEFKKCAAASYVMTEFEQEFSKTDDTAFEELSKCH